MGVMVKGDNAQKSGRGHHLLPTTTQQWHHNLVRFMPMILAHRA